MRGKCQRASSGILRDRLQPRRLPVANVTAASGSVRMHDLPKTGQLLRQFHETSSARFHQAPPGAHRLLRNAAESLRIDDHNLIVNSRHAFYLTKHRLQHLLDVVRGRRPAHYQNVLVGRQHEQIGPPPEMHMPFQDSPSSLEDSAPRVPSKLRYTSFYATESCKHCSSPRPRSCEASG
jgi:hypothetical protein